MTGAPADLRRSLGFWTTVTLIIGTTIGSGIFLVPSDMVRAVGSPGMVLTVWVFGGLLTLAGALTYAELAAAMPQSGGEYVYLKAAYSPVFGFLYGWAQSVVGKPASIAALATAFATYLGTFFPILDTVFYSAAVPIGPGGGPFEVRWGQILAMVTILLLAGINYVGARAGGGVQVVGTALKISLIGALIVIGLGASRGSWANLQIGMAADPGGIAGFFAALAAALFAYDGWSNGPMIGAEVEKPGRNLPRALILGTLAIIAVYLLTNFAYFRMLSGPEVGASPRVATDAATRALGASGGALVSVAAMISIFSSLNGVILSGARVPYAMARDGYFFSWAKSVHARYFTPGVSLIAMCAWACVVLLSGRFQELGRLVVFNSWLSYALAAAGVLVLRRKQPRMSRPYRVLGYPWTPALFVLVALALLYSTLMNFPRESGLGLVLIAAGLPFYFHWKAKNVKY